MKRSISTLEDLDFDASDSEEDYEDLDDESLTNDDPLTNDNIMEDAEMLWAGDHEEESDSDELEDELASLSQELARSKSRSKSQSNPEPPPAKKRKTVAAPAEHVFDLVEPEFKSSKGLSSLRSDTAIADAYGEATVLQEADAADKDVRKKSLRFHTSKIEGASARRQGARNAALGGDDDIPYRDRRKEKPVKHQRGADLDNEEPEPKTKKEVVQDDEGESDGADGYYELIKRTSKERKEKKKAEYEALTTP